MSYTRRVISQALMVKASVLVNMSNVTQVQEFVNV